MNIFRGFIAFSTLCLFSSLALAQIIVPPKLPVCNIENAMSTENIAFYFDDDTTPSKNQLEIYRPYFVGDYVLHSGLTERIAKQLAKKSIEKGKALTSRRHLKKVFKSYCKTEWPSRGRVDNSSHQFKLGFSKGSIGEAAIFAQTGHLLLKEHNRADLAAPFLSSVGEIIPLHLISHPFVEDEEADETSMYLKYELFADRTHLARLNKDKAAVKENSLGFLALIKAHKGFNHQSSWVAPNMMSLSVMEDLQAVEEYKIANVIFESEIASSFDGFGATQNNFRLYTFVVINNFHVYDDEAYIRSLRYEGLLGNYSLFQISSREGWEKLHKENASRYSQLGDMLPSDHPILMREKFYNDIYVYIFQSIVKFPQEMTLAERRTYYKTWKLPVSPDKVKLLAERLYFWSNQFKSQDNLHPHDLAMRLQEVFVLQKWANSYSPHLIKAPEETLEYILDNTPGLHYNQAGAIREDLAKAYMKRRAFPHERETSWAKANVDPLGKILRVYPRNCRGLSETDIKIIHAKRSQIMPRLPSLKKAFDLMEVSYPQLRPGLKPLQPDTYHDPYKLLPIIKWLESGDIGILKAAFPPIEACDEIVIVDE